MTRGTVYTEEQRNCRHGGPHTQSKEHRGTVGTEEGRNSRHRGTESRHRNRGTEEQ